MKSRNLAPSLASLPLSGSMFSQGPQQSLPQSAELSRSWVPRALLVAQLHPVINLGQIFSGGPKAAPKTAQ